MSNIPAYLVRVSPAHQCGELHAPDFCAIVIGLTGRPSQGEYRRQIAGGLARFLMEDCRGGDPETYAPAKEATACSWHL